ncbi:MAG: dihydroorotase [Flavobacteriales bacterium]|nr:dihydroorotase [Flavobacteriales bacterium]
MGTLIKSATIVDARSTLNGKVRDVLIEKGIITSISTSISDGKHRVIKSKGLCVSPGWIDLRANFRDPGFEYKEDLISGAEAAASGGFTRVVLMPSTFPVADSKSAIEYLVSKSKNLAVAIIPTGSLSANMEGKQLAEMFDMYSSGALAFTDDKIHVSTELMVRALEYTRNFGGLVMTLPYDDGVNPAGQINEGPASISTGLKGIPNVSEELALQRDIELLRYCGGRMHVSLISTAKSVEFIRKAKRDKLKISCAIAAHQLNFTDDDLRNFDNNLKVLPPFRNETDQKGIVAGLKDGTIDAICSDHSPEDVEHKNREFGYSEFGVSSIQTAFCSAYSALKNSLTIEQLVSKFTAGPVGILGLQMNKIEEGAEAELTVFSTLESTHFTESSWKSKSKNSPFLKKELSGKVIATIS